MSLYWPYLGADYLLLLEWFVAVIAVVILCSSLDDLFVDAWFWTRQLYRRLFVKGKHSPLSLEQLRSKQEQPIAILLPAWHESNVIAMMIDNLVGTLDYRAYSIFVGTYVNDPATIAEVTRIARRYPRLVRVEVPRPGPTCKADCLNWIIQSVFLYEQRNGIEFSGFVLHDSEDVLHPLELTFFNYLNSRFDLIQIPVMSLEREWYELVAGVYMDEFAEWHGKDLVVRESVSGMVPSAGVGTCFSRRALQILCTDSNNQPFNTASLTEDYDIGGRLAKFGMKSIIAHFPVEFRVRRTRWFGLGRPRELTVSLSLCVREYFPNTFCASYRQKARWVLGIALQGWVTFGWQGTLAERYLLLRDRKGLFTGPVTMAGYFVALQLILVYFLMHFEVWELRYPSLFVTQGWLQTILWLNLLALSLRVAQRFYFVARLYGWEHGLLAIPRMVIGNIVNFYAVARAWKLFLSSRLFGTPIVWDKTTHDFPNAETLNKARQHLGELLLAWQALESDRLSEALARSRADGMPLGRFLVQQGILNETIIADALAYQANLARTEVSPEYPYADRGALSLDLCIRLRILPIGCGDDGQLIVAVGGPLEPSEIAQVEAESGRRAIQRVAKESQINRGLRRLSSSPEIGAGESDQVPLLGDVLLAQGLVDPARLKSALQAYRRSQDGQLGAFLVAEGVLSAEILLQGLAAQRTHSSRSSSTPSTRPA